MALPPLQYKPAPGPDDFRQLRERGYFYVDKSGFIEEWLRSPHQVLLLPRPRRFGKTLNLSMLRCYLERGPTDHRALFEGLAIERAAPEIRAHQGRYPVISLSLKDTKAESYAECLAGIVQVLGETLRTHAALSNSPALSELDRRRFDQLLAGEADPADLRWSLRLLSTWLEAHHGVPVVILIDEYDAPIEAGFQHGYYESIVGFMRGLLGSALKTNPSLYRGVLTGVRRVSKESLFSDLNNVATCSLLDPEFATAFGFTEGEVAEVLQAAGRAEALPDVRAWYNGYLFGGQTIYNPWSVLCFADRGELRDYWVQTSADALLRRLLLQSEGLKGDFETLMSGGVIEKNIDSQVALRDLDREPGRVWSLLLTAGYLKSTAARVVDGETLAQLAIPNVEVSHVWRRSFAGWLQMRIGSEDNLRELKRAILSGATRDVAALLRPMVTDALSYHDVGQGSDNAPERVFHAFVLGLLVSLSPDYLVRSNRESGLGRADVLILPRQAGKPGVVMEFKRIRTDDDETPEMALRDAHAQIDARGYRAELEAVGASPIVAMAVVFDGKRVWVG